MRHSGCFFFVMEITTPTLCGDAPPKEGPTPLITDDSYAKSICPSGGHGRGHRLALQNRAAARNNPIR